MFSEEFPTAFIVIIKQAFKPAEINDKAMENPCECSLKLKKLAITN